MSIAYIVAVWIAAYLLGSINFSILAAKIFRTADPRSTGSKNAGATNLMRTAGARIAVPVLLLDIFRAFAIVYFSASLPFTIWWPFIALPLLLGNLFPVFHRFKGGKGIATSVGILLALSPIAFLMSAAIALAVLGVFRVVSLLSLTLLTVFAAIQAFQGGLCPDSILSVILVLSAVITHRDNLRRVLKRTEPKLF